MDQRKSAQQDFLIVTHRLEPLWREQLPNRIAAATTDYLAGGNHMQIKQTNAAIYASLILILTFELSFSQSILANLAVLWVVSFFNRPAKIPLTALVIFLATFTSNRDVLVYLFAWYE